MRSWALLLAAPWLAAMATQLPPRVDVIAPPGAQRGTEVDFAVRGDRLLPPFGLLFERQGLELVSATPGKDEKSCSLRLRVAPDCALGAHPLHLSAQGGASNLFFVFIGSQPELAEDKDAAGPQQLPLPCTLNGSIRGEEADRYVVELAAGARCVAEIEAMRLGRGPIDLQLSVLGPDGKELHRIDDSALGHKDPWLVFVAPTAGKYEIRVEPAFAASQNRGAYRLHVGDLPRPTLPMPAGGAPGSTLALSLSGGGETSRQDVALPEDGGDWHAVFAQDERGSSPTPVYVRIGGPPETAPTPDAGGALRLAYPASTTGVVTEPEGVRYIIAAKKGETLELRAVALGLRSPLDPTLAVLRADGRVLARDDDAGGAAGDSYVRFAVPQDGDYTVAVRDCLGQASPEHVFRFEAGPRPRTATSRLVVARGETPVLNVPAGGAVGMTLQVDGLDLKEGMALAAGDLPAGVQATFGPLKKGANVVPVVLRAAPDAAHGAAFATLSVVDGQGSAPLAFAQTIPLVTARNDAAILSCVERRMPVGVAAAAPFAVTIVPPKAPAIRGAPLSVKVQLTRRDGYDTDVRIKALWTPAGLSAGEFTIRGKDSEGRLPLDASANAPLGPFVLAVVATSSKGGEGFVQASDFVEVQVEKPWIEAKGKGARTQQGTAATLTFALSVREQARITGPIHARLLGLPRGVEGKAQQCAADATALQFELSVRDDAAIGRHRGVLLELTAGEGDGAALHRFSAGELRIDRRRAPAAIEAAAQGNKEAP